MHDFYAGYYAYERGEDMDREKSDAWQHGYTKAEEDEFDRDVYGEIVHWGC